MLPKISRAYSRSSLTLQYTRPSITSIPFHRPLCSFFLLLPWFQPLNEGSKEFKFPNFNYFKIFLQPLSTYFATNYPGGPKYLVKEVLRLIQICFLRLARRTFAGGVQSNKSRIGEWLRQTSWPPLRIRAIISLHRIYPETLSNLTIFFPHLFFHLPFSLLSVSISSHTPSPRLLINQSFEIHKIYLLQKTTKNNSFNPINV